MSRTRLLRPGFFTDEDVAKLTRDSRLAYAGLWTLCDDAGYFERKPRQIAVALFPYDVDRDEVIETALAELVALEKVDVLGCGIHGVVPSLPIHGAKGGNKAETFRIRHEADCSKGGVSGRVRTSPKDAPTRPPAGAPEVVRTSSDTVDRSPSPPPVRTSPDQSSSVLGSGSVSGLPREKNVLEGTEVVGADAGREAPTLVSHPVATGRSNASPAVSSPRRVSSPVLATPKPPPGWCHPCLDYVHHQSKHRIVAGQAVCDVCCGVAHAAAAAATPDPVATDGLGL